MTATTQRTAPADAAEEFFTAGRIEEACRAVQAVLRARGMELSHNQENQLIGCTDLHQLRAWHLQALRAIHPSEIFSDRPGAWMGWFWVELNPQLERLGYDTSEVEATTAERLFARGYTKSRAAHLRGMLEARFGISKNMTDRIESATITQLDWWIENATMVTEFDEVFTEPAGS